MLAIRQDTHRKNRVVLYRLRERADKVDCRHGDDLADLVEPDLDISASDRAKPLRAAFECHSLRSHLIRDAQSFEQADEIDAHGRPSRRVAASDGLGAQHGALEGLDRTDVRLRASLSYKNADTRLSKVEPGLCQDSSVS